MAEPPTNPGIEKFKTIVVVDDEPMVGTVTRHCLLRAGYDAIVFDDPGQAYKWIEQPNNQVDAIITDHTMPVLTGTELARAIRILRPEVPVIICSGYVTAVYDGHGPPDNVRAILTKPTPTNTLLREVGKALCL